MPTNPSFPIDAPSTMAPSGDIVVIDATPPFSVSVRRRQCYVSPGLYRDDVREAGMADYASATAPGESIDTSGGFSEGRLFVGRAVDGAEPRFDKPAAVRPGSLAAHDIVGMRVREFDDLCSDQAQRGEDPGSSEEGHFRDVR